MPAWPFRVNVVLIGYLLLARLKPSLCMAGSLQTPRLLTVCVMSLRYFLCTANSSHLAEHVTMRVTSLRPSPAHGRFLTVNSYALHVTVCVCDVTEAIFSRQVPDQHLAVHVGSHRRGSGRLTVCRRSRPVSVFAIIKNMRDMK